MKINKLKLLSLMALSGAMAGGISTTDRVIYKSPSMVRNKYKKLKQKKRFENKARATQARINKTWKH